MREKEINPYYMGNEDYPGLEESHVISEIVLQNDRLGYAGGRHGRGQYEYTTVLLKGIEGWVPDVGDDGKALTLKGYEENYADEIKESRKAIKMEQVRKERERAVSCVKYTNLQLPLTGGQGEGQGEGQGGGK